MIMRRGLRKTAALVATSGILAVGAVGCSGGSDDGADRTDEGGTTSQSDTGGDEAASGSSDAGGASGGASDGGGDSAASAADYGPDTDLRIDAPPVQAADAVRTAQDEVGDGTLHAVELDYDDSDGAWQWDVKILAGSTGHEVVIDAVTGEVVADESESTDDQEKAIDLEDPMTYDEALDAATAERDGELRGWKLEYDDGSIHYEFDIAAGADEDEVSVDVDTGNVTVD